MLHEMVEAYWRWQTRRSITRELWALDDHELNDLGIGRGQIAEIANLSALR